MKFLIFIVAVLLAIGGIFYFIWNFSLDEENFEIKDNSQVEKINLGKIPIENFRVLDCEMIDKD